MILIIFSWGSSPLLSTSDSESVMVMHPPPTPQKYAGSQVKLLAFNPPPSSRSKQARSLKRKSRKNVVVNVNNIHRCGHL
jgi:hypothetical protein